MHPDDDTDVYGLLTELSKHIFETYRQPFHRNALFTYDHSNKIIKYLRSKAFEILLKKVDYLDHKQIDPIVEIQKHIFVMKLRLSHSCNAATLEKLLEEIQEHSYSNASIYSVLELLVQLKNFNIAPEPITNIFYYGKANPAVPEITYARDNTSFRIYPMECFMLSDKFEATLETQRLQITRVVPTTVMNELHYLHGIVKSKGTVGIESRNVSVTSGFISAHAFDTEVSETLIPSNQCYLKRLTVDPHLSREIATYDREEKSKYTFSSEKDFSPNYSYFPMSRSEAVAIENESLLGTWKSSDHSVIDELDYPADSWNWQWKHIGENDTFFFHRRTWERFGEIQHPRELMFMTDTSTASVYLETIKRTSSLPLLSGKAINSALLLEEVSVQDFVNDVKSMLLGIESNSFHYTDWTGFTLRENISVYGASSKSLKNVCREAINWGNCFRFLSQFIMPKSQKGDTSQEGFIFKAVCTNVKELLLHYQAVLVRIFSKTNHSERLLKIFQKVRPVADLITKVAELCEPYKGNQCTLREGSSIIARIYNEAIQLTNTKVALVFYSLLKSCCEVYFRFLQKWMFEGICDDVYGEFMIKTRPQYLRSRDYKFWTKTFIVRNEAIPGFLSGLSESILQCGKTVRLLRVCNAKNPVCHVCVTEQPEVKVCLSVTALYEQSLKYRKYEEKGKSALGPILSLSMAIQSKKQMEKEMAEYVVRAQHDTLTRIKGKLSIRKHSRNCWDSRDSIAVSFLGEREAALKKIAQTKRDFLTNLKEQCSVIEAHKKNKKQKKEKEELSDGFPCALQENLRPVERTNILNYYENLTLDIEKRCMRSQWRAKRMAFFHKRIDVLSSTKQNLQHQLKIKQDGKESKEQQEGPVSGSCLLTEIPISFEDENKNYARTSCRRTVDTEFVVTPKLLDSRTDRDNSKQQDQFANCAIITMSNNNNGDCDYGDDDDRKNNNNNNNNNNVNDNDNDNDNDNNNNNNDDDDNEENNFCILSNNRGIEKSIEKNISKLSGDEAKMKTAIVADTNQLYATIPYITPTVTIERPTVLNVKIDNAAAIQSYVDKDSAWSLEGNMTPNNNELDIRRIRIATDTNDLPRDIVDNADDDRFDTGANERNDLETPMSCTTDNLTSSVQSPVSQIHHSEDRSPIEVSSIDMLSSNSRTLTKSPTAMKKDATFSDIFALQQDEPPPTVTSSTTTSLTVADIELIDHSSLQAYLEKSIRIPLEVQSRLVNSAIIKYFVEENNLLLHLHSLRSYFFLLNGEFAKSLTDSLYTRLYEISLPIELFNSATLTNLLERALVNSFNSIYVNSELLGLSATNAPIQLHMSDPGTLDCLSLNYKITWPLNIIFDDPVMQRYGKVFKFLITSGRVSWVLQEDFNMMKRERKTLASSSQYHKLQLYRHSMTQFMNALHNYLTCSVLYASWTEFEKDLENSLTLDQIYLSHVNYIKRILSRCMLNARGEKVRLCLNNIFKVILKFHNRLRSQTWTMKSTGYVHPNFKRLEQMYQAFCELRAYMAHVAFKLATSGYQPHLMHFLNALNINHLYDLTIKSHRSSSIGPSDL
ncbi:gamma-tubulin complex component 6 isoform X2 [Nomia melanderi]|uniref:gamma-tubulin complex component 6 isoform X2 n=1 Tax=Nomia melanderi TaxID=2448451 RepID=UPI003FCE5517